MPSILSRRSRLAESDEDEEDSRPGTPASVGPNDSKRARRSHNNEGPLAAITGHRLTNGLSSLAKARNGRRGRTKNDDVQARSNHQPGAIVRVKLNNFVTYTSAEFLPGPNLNMVIGPNGTGKSTLVCAMCLGLGWGTQQLGRAKDVSEFVKHGCREASIEIELQRDPTAMRRNPIITRLIKRDGNKSSYTINGQPKSGKAVLELAKSFSIQIDNLCQFLPQDRVVEFAAMTPVELLHSTQLAAAPRDMIDAHEDLKKLRGRQKEMTSDNRGDTERLANLENRQEMQRADVERMRQRAEVKRRLDWLERCRPIPKYSDAKAKANEAKLRQKQLTAELKVLKNELAPALRRVNEKQQLEVHARALKEQRKKDVEGGEKKADQMNAKVDKLEEKLQEFDNMVNAEKRAIQGRKEEQKRTQQVIARLKKQMEEEPEAFDPRAINGQVQQRVDRRRQIEDKVQELKENVDALKAQGQERVKQIEQAKRRLASLETQSGQQENKLQQASSDAYRAWQWIKENRDKFEHHVYGPPIVECSLKDPRYADAIEILFQANDFKIFTVQSKRDFSLLQKKLTNEMKLHDVSLRVCSIDSLDQFRSPMSTEQLRSLGLDGWALDVIDGPATVLAMLCNEKFLHQTAISLRSISSEQYDHIADTTISGFVAGQTSYRFTRRKEYGSAGTSAATKPLRPARVWTNQPIDQTAKAELQRNINEYRSDTTEIKAELERIKAEIRDDLGTEYSKLEEEIEELKREKEDRQKALTAFKALPAKLARQEEKLANINENLDGVRERINGIHAQKDKILFQKAETTIQYASVVSALRTLHAELLGAEVMHIQAQSDFETQRARNEDVNQLLQSKQSEEKEALATSKACLDAASQLVRDVYAIRDEGQTLERGGDSSLMNLLREITANKSTADDLEADIDSEKAKLELTQGGSAGIIKEFEDRARDIERLKERVEAFRRDREAISAGITEIRGKWEPRLDALVAKISDAFSDSFARIGCAGQVTVYKASGADGENESLRTTSLPDEEGNGLDFANWAIHVSVKFRETEPLSLLDSHRQSGGERAVSTIFYLMALQSLSRAPFRVVDEINQGMDPRNERMVHGRMVDIACGEAGDDGEVGAGSQYFLITPKLLNGLKYRRGMTVLCIASGENMPAAGEENKVDFGAWVKKAVELGLASHEERRVDSGVHLGSSFGAGVSDGSGLDRSRSESRITEVGA